MSDDDKPVPDNRGGRREGAGRPVGALGGTGKLAIKREAERKEAFDKIRNMLIPIVGEDLAHYTPLDYMMHAAAFAAGEGDWYRAAGIAKDAAPYLHSRLSSMDINAQVDSKNHEELSDKELLALLREQQSTVITVLKKDD